MKVQAKLLMRPSFAQEYNFDLANNLAVTLKKDIHTDEHIFMLLYPKNLFMQRMA